MEDLLKNLTRLKEMGNSVPEGVVAIYLYGSSIKGRLMAESDIDIAILPSYRTTEDERLILISKVESIVTKLLREIDIRREVSIVNLRNKFLALTLQYEIVTHGLLLYEKDKFERIEFENPIIGEYFDFIPYINLLRKRKYGYLREKV